MSNGKQLERNNPKVMAPIKMGIKKRSDNAIILPQFRRQLATMFRQILHFNAYEHGVIALIGAGPRFNHRLDG